MRVRVRRLLLSSAGLARLHRTESDMIGKAKNLTRSCPSSLP